VAFTLLAHNEDGWEDFTTTPSPLTITGVAPGTNCLLVLWCGLIQRGPDSWSTLTVTSSASTTSNNPTWTVPTPISGTGGDSIATSMYAYTEIGSTDPGTFTVSIGFNAFSPADDANWQIAIVKVPAAEYNVGSPIGGSVVTKAQAGNGALTQTLSAAPASGDVTLAFDIADQNSAAQGATMGTGTWTNLMTGHAGISQAVSVDSRTGSTSASSRRRVAAASPAHPPQPSARSYQPPPGPSAARRARRCPPAE
jgi:hypothetical protein